MALHPNFPKSPYEVLDPSIRRFPADELLRDIVSHKLLPPLVTKLRLLVKERRDNNYTGASETSRSLLNRWFIHPHYLPKSDGTMVQFQYYFAQREALETVVYLHDVAQVKDKLDLFKYDSSWAISTSMFPEEWRRFVIKMATGSGKTKVMSLVLAWSYFHRLYEPDSDLSKNFLVITPNIIVLDRIRSDFDGLRIFHSDPVLPDNGWNWRDRKADFQLTLHIQDELQNISSSGNIFLTNIHRVFEKGDKVPSLENQDTRDYFLGSKWVAKTLANTVDLGDIVRSVDELMVINDEAHHIHDEKLARFTSIQDIHNRLLQKWGKLAMQIDVTATPKHNNGWIFVQTISDYPLVEAIAQNVVKHPVVPDQASRAKLQEKKSSKYTEKYEDYIHLGYLEWRKSYEEHQKMGKKAVLFVMTDDTKNCDDVAEYLRNRYPEFHAPDSVLVIHTKDNGEISESSSGKNEEELKILRDASNNIDSFDSPYKAVVSVLMLREGWDVKNVTNIVWLRAFATKSKVLPEQTLGRGLRRMYREESVDEYVSVVGTEAFMEFVDSIQSEWVVLEKREMGWSKPIAPIVVEVDTENTKKDIEKLDIKIPVLTPRIYREYKNLAQLDPKQFDHKNVPFKQFTEEQMREIVFQKIIDDEIDHIISLDWNIIPSYHSVVTWYAKAIMRELRLVWGAWFDVLFGKIKEFIKYHLFTQEVDLEDLNTLRNLSELEASKTIINTFKKYINALTVTDSGDAEIRDYITISKTRPFVVKTQSYLVPKRSVFNKIIGDSHFELEFANFLEGCEDIISYAKNYFGVNFKMEYQNTDGDISNYYPDFFVKVSDKEIYIIETKWREDLDDLEKVKRLKMRCEDVNKASGGETIYKMLYIKQEDYEKQIFHAFSDVVRYFTD